MICVNSVKVTPESVTLKAGQWYYNARAEVCPLDAECRRVRWYSNNTSVATVNATTGYIYAVKAGSAKIYAEATDGSGEKDYITVNVTSGPIYVDSVTLSRTSISLEEGDSYTLYANVFPSNADNRTIAWSSSNENIAEVSNGTITAKTAGTAYIYARATDGSEKYAQCQVTVTEEVLVTSVSVSPARKTMTVGDTAYLHEIVCPLNASNKEVVWSSSDLSVVTVNYSNGFIMAVKEGVANVYATAADGSGRSGVCEITVEPIIHVESVMIYTPMQETMYVGDTMTLQATVCPMDATDQTITWSSSNEEVAEVGMYTGELVIKSAGTVTITATSADGQHTDSRTITAWIDTVIIKKDGVYTKVIFQSTGKEWHGVHNDMLFNETNAGYEVLRERIRYNFFNYYNEDLTDNAQDVRPENIKQYTDDELRLLYAIDPYGVASYVSQYSLAKHYNTVEELRYKDHMFYVLFGREPNYYHHLGEHWYEIDKDDPEAELSESQAIFGGGGVTNDISWYDAVTFIIDVACLVFKVPFFGEIADELASIASFIVSTVKVLVTGEGSVREELASFLSSESFERTFTEKKLHWACGVVTLFQDIVEIVDSIVVDTSNFYGKVMNYCAYESNYLVYAQLKNAHLCKIDDICKAVNEYNNNNY